MQQAGEIINFHALVYFEICANFSPSLHLIFNVYVKKHQTQPGTMYVYHVLFRRMVGLSR